MALRGCVGCALEPRPFCLPASEFSTGDLTYCIILKRLLWSCWTGAVCQEEYQGLGRLCQMPCPLWPQQGKGEHVRCFPSQALALLGCLPDPMLQKEVSSALGDQGENTALNTLLMQFWFVRWAIIRLRSAEASFMDIYKQAFKSKRLFFKWLLLNF